MTSKPPHTIRDDFNMAADETGMRLARDTSQTDMFSRPATPQPSDTDRHLKRPSVPERAKGLDYAGDTMARYIGGLETRLVDHMRKHLPRWQQQESLRVLNTWHAPGARHPAPSWAAARDARADAADYAAALLRERFTSRLQRLGDIRIARMVGGYKQADPLHLIFHNRAPAVSNRIKRKQ